MTQEHEVTLSGAMTPAPGTRNYRRIVTGINHEGASVIEEDTQARNVQVVANTPTMVVTNLWRHAETPVVNKGPANDTLDERVPLAPPENGSVFRMVEFPPDHHWQGREDGPADQVHATPSLDYAIVLQGEIWAVLDQDETLMRPGDVLIQRGTRHAWSNRSDEQAVVAFVLIGGNVLDNSNS